MKDHGLISCLADYAALPVQVVEDARLMMASEDRQRKRAEPAQEPRRRQ